MWSCNKMCNKTQIYTQITDLTKVKEKTIFTSKPTHRLTLNRATGEKVNSTFRLKTSCRIAPTGNLTFAFACFAHFFFVSIMDAIYHQTIYLTRIVFIEIACTITTLFQSIFTLSFSSFVSSTLPVKLSKKFKTATNVCFRQKFDDNFQIRFFLHISIFATKRLVFFFFLDSLNSTNLN